MLTSQDATYTAKVDLLFAKFKTFLIFQAQVGSYLNFRRPRETFHLLCMAEDAASSGVHVKSQKLGKEENRSNHMLVTYNATHWGTPMATKNAAVKCI
jgi:hypothetical protein